MNFFSERDEFNPGYFADFVRDAAARVRPRNTLASFNPATTGLRPRLNFMDGSVRTRRADGVFRDVAPRVG
jgi:hypothetical protein